MGVLLVLLGLCAGDIPVAVAVSMPVKPGFGISMSGIPGDLSGLQAIESAIGAAPSLVMWYVQWATSPEFPAAEASAVAAAGSVPEITWEPWDPSAGLDQPTYSLAAIASGAQDAYLTTWAREIKAWGQPIDLRFAAEMNGNWYPWDEGVNNNAPGSYVAAWRHVHDVFSAVGANNVTWVWAPNVSYPGSTPLAELWPGSSYVDAVGIDGYNWGPLDGHTWQSFTDVFSATLQQVETLTSLPISISETGSTEVGGDKAAWITQMFSQLASWPQVRGFTWFDWDKETDWRIDSSSSALAAFRAGISTYSRGTNASPIGTAPSAAGGGSPGGGGQSAPPASSGAPSAAPGAGSGGPSNATMGAAPESGSVVTGAVPGAASAASPSTSDGAASSARPAPGTLRRRRRSTRIGALATVAAVGPRSARWVAAALSARLSCVARAARAAARLWAR